ncbi:MAG: TolC family protein, partial [Bdellovibrio sp.]
MRVLVFAVASLSFSSFLFCSSSSFGSEQSGPSANSLKLKAALQAALSENPSLKVTLEKENQAQAQVPVARSVIFPTLSATASSMRAKDAVNVGVPRFNGEPFNVYSSGLKLNQTLFQVGAFSAINAAKKDVEISKLNIEINKRDLTSSVIKTYFQVILYSRKMETFLAQKKIAQESVVTAKRREHIGRGSSLEVLQAKTQLALLDGQLESTQNQLQEATATLANLMGDGSSLKFVIEDKMEAPEIKAVDSVVDLKNFKIPEVSLTDVSIERIDDQKSILWGQNLPSLSLIGNYSYSNFLQSDLYNENGASWSVGLQLTIPLFSGFSTLYQNSSLNAQKAQFVLNKLAVLNQLSYQQITSRKKLETAQASIETGKEALKLAISSVNEARRSFNFANIDFFQFLTVQ